LEALLQAMRQELVMRAGAFAMQEKSWRESAYEGMPG
jgi:hypothetical protein